MRRHDGIRQRKSVAAALAAMFLVLSACSGDHDPAAIPVSGRTASSSSATTQPTDTSTDGFQLNAQDIAFDVDLIEVTVGEATTVTFNNNDTGIPHNFHVEAGDVDAKTDITPGPDTQSLEFTIDEAGTYTFICDVHPNMTGEVVAT